MQLTHDNSKFNRKSFPIIIVCNNVSNAPNIGSILRLADAFGVEKVYFCGEHIPIGRRMKKTSRSTENVVDFEVSGFIGDVVQALKKKGYHLLALEITAKSVSIDSYKTIKTQPIALIIGGENHGIDNNILAKCDSCIHINMYGKNSSMNVTHAAAIALHSLTNQLV